LAFKFALTVLAAMLVVTSAGCVLDLECGRGEEELRVKKGGAQLWAENCRRCHNLRAPTSYSADQWEVAVNHMRIRAGLTAEEARMITEFLKAAH
jgi:hypothetical protein